MEFKDCFNAMAAMEAAGKETKEKIAQQKERDFDKRFYLETLSKMNDQITLLRQQNEQLKKDAEVSKKDNKYISILSIIAIVLALLTLISTIVFGLLGIFN